jgi:hypothetical protein
MVRIDTAFIAGSIIRTAGSCQERQEKLGGRLDEKVPTLLDRSAGRISLGAERQSGSSKHPGRIAVLDDFRGSVLEKQAMTETHHIDQVFVLRGSQINRLETSLSRSQAISVVVI